jgi:transposase
MAVERKNLRFVPIKTDDQLEPVGNPQSSGSSDLAPYGGDRPAMCSVAWCFRRSQRRTTMADILENGKANLSPQMRNLR